jgi:hypothetical protein
MIKTFLIAFALVFVAGAAQAQVADHNCEMPQPGTPAYSYWILHGFGLPRAPPGYYYPQGSCTYIPIQPVQQTYQDQDGNQAGSSQVGSSPETEATNRAYEYATTHGACTRIRDRYTDSPADVASCDQHDRGQPECLDYKGFAEVWFNMAKSHDQAMPYQSQMIDSMPTARGSKDTVIYHIPGYLDKLRRLLAIAKTSKAKSGAAFGAYAYKRCMAGNTF